MTRKDIKEWAKNKIKDNFWMLLLTIFVASILTSLSFTQAHVEGKFIHTTYYYFGWIFYFVQVGITFYMVKYVTGQNTEFKDIFSFGDDFLRCLGAELLQMLFIFLWGLLLIVPGIICAISYAFVPYLLADSKYHDMKVMDILKKSKEMMVGHKWDLFVFGLSFIGWHLLAVLTLGLLEIWIIPYQTTATTRFLNDIKTDYEEAHNIKDKETPAAFCAECGTKIKKGSKYCNKCGKKI